MENDSVFLKWKRFAAVVAIIAAIIIESIAKSFLDRKDDITSFQKLFVIVNQEKLITRMDLVDVMNK
jgi:hypothetical protein